MDKVVLVPIRDLKEKNALTKFLYGLGLIERKKKDPLITPILQIFLKNKEKSLSYEDILRALPKTKGRNLRSNVVKICNKLTESGVIERTAHVPRGKKRWERAFKFISFYNAIELTKQKTEFMIEDLEKMGEKLDEE